MKALTIRALIDALERAAAISPAGDSTKVFGTPTAKGGKALTAIDAGLVVDQDGPRAYVSVRALPVECSTIDRA